MRNQQYKVYQMFFGLKFCLIDLAFWQRPIARRVIAWPFYIYSHILPRSIRFANFSLSHNFEL